MKAMQTVVSFCSVIAIALAHSTSSDAAFLSGQTIQIGRIHGNSPEDLDAIVTANVVVGPDTELTDFGAHEPIGLSGLFDIDISDTHIEITASRDQQIAGVDYLQFNDIFNAVPHIRGVAVEPATNWEGFSAVRATGFGDNIFVNLSTLSGKAGQQILLTVVPEPAATVLALTGLAVLALARRKKKKKGDAAQ